MGEATPSTSDVARVADPEVRSDSLSGTGCITSFCEHLQGLLLHVAHTVLTPRFHSGHALTLSDVAFMPSQYFRDSGSSVLRVIALWGMGWEQRRRAMISAIGSMSM